MLLVLILFSISTVVSANIVRRYNDTQCKILTRTSVSGAIACTPLGLDGYQSFTFLNIDPYCIPTLYGADATHLICSGSCTIGKWGSCYSNAYAYHSIECSEGDATLLVPLKTGSDHLTVVTSATGSVQLLSYGAAHSEQPTSTPATTSEQPTGAPTSSSTSAQSSAAPTGSSDNNNSIVNLSAGTISGVSISAVVSVIGLGITIYSRCIKRK